MPTGIGNFRKMCLWKNPSMLRYYVRNRFSEMQNLRDGCSFKKACVCSSNSSADTPVTYSETELRNAKVIYSVAPAMGHNKEAHPECNSRVPAILSALEGMELTSKIRGADVIELQSFKPASADDISSVHAKDYVSGLEKAMDQASDKGLIFIDGSGPTYATATTFQESLLAAGAGISLIDTVVITQPKAWLLQKLALNLLWALLW